MDTNFELLSDEVIVTNILPQLSIEDLIRLCQVDTRFNQICQDERVWQMLSKQKFNIDDPGHLSWKDVYFYGIEIKQFGQDPEYDNDILNKIFQNLKQRDKSKAQEPLNAYKLENEKYMSNFTEVLIAHSIEEGILRLNIFNLKITRRAIRYVLNGLIRNGIKIDTIDSITDRMILRLQYARDRSDTFLRKLNLVNVVLNPSKYEDDEEDSEDDDDDDDDDDDGGIDIGGINIFCPSAVERFSPFQNR